MAYRSKSLSDSDKLVIGLSLVSALIHASNATILAHDCEPFVASIAGVVVSILVVLLSFK